MPQTEPWTVLRLLKWTTDYLKQHDCDSARLESEILLAEARGCERIDLYTSYDQTPSEGELTAFRELVRRRAEGTPVAYLVGKREFYSLSFRVTPDVLIPRAETEHLVVTALDLIERASHDGRTVEVADVGSGSGAIAVSLALHAPNCRVVAIDISPAALEIARYNVNSHAVAQRVELVEGDLLASLDEQRRFDFVVSNPPYVSQSELAELPSEIKDHEPQVALLAGKTGSEVIARLIPQSAQRLRAGGWLLMEISPMIEQRVTKLLLDDGRFDPPAIEKDLAGFARVVMAQRRKE